MVDRRESAPGSARSHQCRNPQERHLHVSPRTTAHDEQLRANLRADHRESQAGEWHSRGHRFDPVRSITSFPSGRTGIATGGCVAVNLCRRTSLFQVAASEQ